LYKLKKFARKHRAALVTAGAFAFLLVAATAVSASLAVWANNERVRAAKAEKSAKEQQGRAQDREQMAIDAVKRYGEVVRETPRLKDDPSLAKLRATLLAEPLTFFKRLRDRLQADQATTPDSLARLAAASFELGTLTDEIGDKQEALHAYETSQVIRERLARENPSETQFQSDLAASHDVVGILQIETGRPTEARASLEHARTIRERLARENPSVIPFQRDLAASYNNIGNQQSAMGRRVEALHSYEQGRAIQERLLDENPSITQFQRDLAWSHNNIGVLQSQMGRPADALESYERALAMFERLTRNTPSVTEFQSGLAASHNNIGKLKLETGRPAEALKSFEEARRIQEQLVHQNPSVTQFTRELALSHNNIGVLQIETGRPAEASVSYEHARAIRERLAIEHPASPEFASDLGGTLNNMAQIDLDERRVEAARLKLMQAIEWRRKALAASPNHPTYRQFLANHLTNLIRVAEAQCSPNLADKARRALTELATSNPALAALDARLAAVFTDTKTPRAGAERTELAYRAYEKALYASSAQLYAEALANDPKLADDRQLQHRYNAACASALAGCGPGNDDAPPDDAAKVKLRRQAREWLQAELAAWGKVLDAGTAEMKGVVPKTLEHWKADADLAAIRDEKELAKLPDRERAAFQQLWKDIDQLLTKAMGSK